MRVKAQCGVGAIQVFLLLVLTLPEMVCASEQMNLLSNGGFESGTDSEGIPLGWSAYVPGATAEIRIDSPDARQGSSSTFLKTSSDVKAILVSEPVPVAAGETLILSIFFRCEHLATSSAGTIAFNAGFLNRDRHYVSWDRTQVAAPAQANWSQLTKEVVVPANTAYATLQIGLNKMTGSLWLDDASLSALLPQVVRFDLTEKEFPPALVELPLVLINRDPTLSGKSVQITTQPGGHTLQATFSKRPETCLDAPFTLPKRGTHNLKATLGTTDAFVAQDTVTVPEVIRMEPLVPTHFCIEDGTPRLEGRLWIFEEPERRASTQLYITLRNVSGIVAQRQIQSLPQNPVLFTLEALDADLGDYILDVSALANDALVGSASQDWHVIPRFLSEVVLGENGYLVVNGKPFFPIGMFNGSRLAEQSMAGFNVAHGYNAMATSPGTVPNNQQAKNFLDQAHSLGMKTLMLVTHGGHSRSVDDEFVRRVRMFRNHPGLLAWDEEEGVARGEMPLSNLSRMHAILKKEAPEHPFMVGDARAPIFDVHDRSDFFPVEYMDLSMWWWYPFPLDSNTEASALEGEQQSQAGVLDPPSFLTLAKTSKPIWVGIQAYRKPNRSDGRFPTPDEYRAQAYLSLIHGAKGLMYYVGSGSGGNGILNKPEEGNWEYLKQLVAELRSLEEVFMSADAAKQVQITPEDSPVSVRLKQTQRGLVLLAANRCTSRTSVSFLLDTGESKSATVLFEDRTVAIAKDILEDTFAPLEVHVYAIGR